MSRRTRRWCSSVLSVTLVLGVAEAAWAAPAQVVTGVVGTVDTLAGPGYCDGPTGRDPSSTAVGALAVAPGGAVYFDTGAPDSGAVGISQADSGVASVVAGPQAGKDWSELQAGQLPAGPSASRIAATPTGGALVAQGNAVGLLGGDVVAGDPQDQSHAASGDGGPAVAAHFAAVRSIASDVDGSLYIADTIDAARSTFRIRFVNRSSAAVTFYSGTPGELRVAPGAIDTIAGTAGSTATSDGVSARDAVLLGTPPAMAVGNGLLYVASSDAGTVGPGGSRVQLVNLKGSPVNANGVTVAGGRVMTVAGGALIGYFGDGGPALSARFGYLPGIATDGPNLYLADEEHHRIRKVDAAGMTSTIIGRGGTGPADGGFNGNGLPGDQTRLNRPYDVKVSPEGIFVSDRGNGEIRYVDASGRVQAVGGVGAGVKWQCIPGPAGVVGADDRPRQGEPSAVAAAADGSLYFVGSLPDVKRISPDGVITGVAGTRTPAVCPPPSGACPIEDHLPASQAHFKRPTGIAVGPDGFYVYDGGNRRVRFVNTGGKRITLNGVTIDAGEIATVVGSGSPGDGGGDGPALGAELSTEGAVAVGPNGELVVADIGNKRILAVDAKGRLSTILKSGAPNECCVSPVAMTTDADGDLYVVNGASADIPLPGHPIPPPSAQVWFLNRSGRARTVYGQDVPAGAARPVAGNGVPGAASEGVAALDSNLLSPNSVALDKQGNLYIGDDTDYAVTRVDPSGQIHTVVGTGHPGSGGDGLPGALTAIQPRGLAIDACGNLLIADQTNDRVRRLNVVPPCASTLRSTPRPSRAWGFMWWAVPVAIVVVGLALGLRWRSRGARE